MKPSIAFFDFDGTITSSDTLAVFIQFNKGRIKFYIGLFILSPMLIAFKIGFLSRQKAKENLISFFFKNINEIDFNESAKYFATLVIPRLIRQKAAEKLEWHKQQGHIIVIVSASPLNWVLPWCQTAGYFCLATRLSVINGRITGNIEGKNCYGKVKSEVISKNFDLSEYEDIYAYGDSKGDLPMLKLANNAYYKPFRL